MKNKAFHSACSVIFVVSFIMSCAYPTSQIPNSTPKPTPNYSPDPTPSKTYIDSVPDGAKAIGNAYAADPSNSVNEFVLPIGWTSATPWMISIANSNLGSTGKVEVDYLYLIAVINDTNYMIASDDYDTWSTSNGGLYTTVPRWFDTDDHTPMQVMVSNGIMSFDPNDAPANIWHWWTPNRAVIPSESSSIYLLAKIRVTGNACIQVGIDWWKTTEARWDGYNVNNQQACVSKWYFNSPGWQTIKINAMPR